MRLRDLAGETWEALDANRGRSLLTVLGVVIGIAAVIAMTALIGGIKQGLVGELGLSQARLVNMSVYGDAEMKQGDLGKVEEGLPDYEFVSGMCYSYAGGIASDTASADSGSLMGVGPEYFEAMGLDIEQGRAFTSSEDETASTVVVIDQPLAQQLFGSTGEDVVGQTVRVKGIGYRVVGVAGGNADMNGSGTAYIPLQTCEARINGSDRVDGMFGMAREGVDIDGLVEQTKQFLASYYHLSGEDAQDQIYVSSMQSVIDQLNTVMASFQLLMTSVASISLVVGGIGIMNMMLTNVTERIREIGLRKALGARRSDITKQFLLESVCLTLAGGAIGIVVGYVGAFALSGLAAGMLASDSGTTMSITPAIDPAAVAAVVGICVLIGVVFGYYPARRAAKLDPVESLHYQ